ncbi:MAG: sulfite exporter TauE/SafE family protein [Candidatus Hydrogenedentes bacterium]|nr:sulfite exporter TauE/SafE family protein [Candidatus Hydrogenedentota bacterium]
MTFLTIALAFALGAFVQAIAGFGSALVIMPILTVFIGVQTAASVMALVGATVTVLVFWQNRRGLRWREAGLLLCGSVVGIPLGAWALKTLPAAPVVAFLGVGLLAYALYGFATQGRNQEVADGYAEPVRAATWKDRTIGVLVGFSAGLLGGAYATDGPPLVIYGAVKRWPKESFRAILQACFFVDGILIILSHGAGGLVTREVFTYCLYGVPGMLLGLGAGILLDRRINHALFHRVLLWVIAFLGAGLLARGVMSM